MLGQFEQNELDFLCAKGEFVSKKSDDGFISRKGDGDSIILDRHRIAFIILEAGKCSSSRFQNLKKTYSNDCQTTSNCP